MEADGKHLENRWVPPKTLGPEHFEDHVGQVNSYSQMEHHEASEGKHVEEVNDHNNDEGGS